jgi:hypothetical protein
METLKHIIIEAALRRQGTADGGIEGKDMRPEIKSGRKGEQNAQQ